MNEVQRRTGSLDKADMKVMVTQLSTIYNRDEQKSISENSEATVGWESQNWTVDACRKEKGFNKLY